MIMVANNDQKVSIRRASSLVHKGHQYIRSLIEAGKVSAWRNGGSVARPRLVVKIGELQKAIEADTLYIPKPKNRTYRPINGRIDRAMQDL
jgi:hypothetical protein